MENENFELYEAYLSKTLTTQENKAFEERLVVDLDFANKFEDYKEVNGFLKHRIGNKVNNEAFATTIKQADQTYFQASAQKAPEVIRFKPWMYAIAASVVLLFGIIFTQNSTPTYSDYAKYGDLSLSVRGEANATIVKAEEAFNTRDYTNAIIYLNELLTYYPTNQEILLYKAISLIETNQYKEADFIFKTIYEGKSAFKNRALWYAVLSKLKQKDIKACKNLLKAIPKGTADYEKAKELLEKL